MIALHFVSENFTPSFTALPMNEFHAHFKRPETAIRRVAVLARRTVTALEGRDKEETKTWNKWQSSRYLATDLVGSETH